MRILVVGAGAMGSLFGGALWAMGHDVTLVTTNPGHVDAVRKDGLVVDGPGGRRTFHPGIFAAVPPGEPMDLAVIFVKAYKTSEAALAAKTRVGDGTVVLTLQNGLGNAEALTAVLGGATRLVAGATYEGAILVQPGLVRHSGGGPTFLAPWPGTRAATADAAAVAGALTAAGIPASLTDEPREMIWRKVAVNAAINPTTALVGCENGALLRLGGLTRVMADVLAEARAVAAAEGVALGADLLDEVLRVAEATSANRSSMLRDFDLRRRTEIAALNGAIAVRGVAHGIATPMNSALAELVEAHTRTHARD